MPTFLENLAAAIREWDDPLMQPREFERTTCFAPDALKVICTAFDDAWREISSHISEDLGAIERARTSLASIVLGLANGHQTVPDGLKALAVAVFYAKHRIKHDDFR